MRLFTISRMITAFVIAQRFDQLPFIVGEVAGANGFGQTARGSHSSTSAAPPNQATFLESQMIIRIQLFSRTETRRDGLWNDSVQ